MVWFIELVILNSFLGGGGCKMFRSLCNTDVNFTHRSILHPLTNGI